MESIELEIIRVLEADKLAREIEELTGEAAAGSGLGSPPYGAAVAGWAAR